MTDSTAKAVNYCYQCGRRVNRQQDHCWYCNASMQRRIREPRRCSFCGEEVRAEAIKCRHCGEFLDGRPTPAAGPQQIIYVIDKDLLRAARDFRLMAGQPVPPEVARVLDAQTVQGIETNQPRLIQAPGVRVLPAPAEDDGEIVDVPAIRVDEPANRPGHQPGKGRRLLGESKDLVVADGGAARGGANLPAVRGAETKAVGKPLGKVGGWLYAKHQEAAPKDDAIEAEAHDVYRICPNCQTEILARDNYCFHCGAQHHRTVADVRLAAKARWRFLNSLLDLLTVVMLIMYGAYKVRLFDLPLPGSVAEPLLALIAGALCLTGLFRGRGFMKKLWALALIGVFVVLFRYL